MCSEQHNAEKTQNSEILMLSSLNTSNNDKIITSPLSWVGNKLEFVVLSFQQSKSYINYYEPFLGSGSVLFYVLRQQLKII